MSHMGSLSCCGIQELANIYEDDGPEESIMEVDPFSQAFVVFSIVDNDSRDFKAGKALARLIEKAKLGAIVSLPVSINPNTDNRLKTWMWKVNKRALRAYQNKLRKADPDRWRNDDPYYNDYWGGY